RKAASTTSQYTSAGSRSLRSPCSVIEMPAKAASANSPITGDGIHTEKVLPTLAAGPDRGRGLPRVEAEQRPGVAAHECSHGDVVDVVCGQHGRRLGRLGRVVMGVSAAPRRLPPQDVGNAGDGLLPAVEADEQWMALPDLLGVEADRYRRKAPFSDPQ